MRTRSIRAIVVAAVALGSLLGLTSASQAAVWQHQGNGSAFTATAPAARFALSGGPAINCSGTVAPGNTIGGTLTGNNETYIGTDPGVRLASVTTQRFTSCTTAGISSTVSCTTTTKFLGITWTSNGGTSPNWFNSLTNGRFASTTCTVIVTGGCVTTITSPTTSGIPVTYTNASSFSLRGKFTTSGTGQNLTCTTNGSVSCSNVGIPSSGTAAFGSSSTPPGPLTYTITSSFSAIIRVV